MGAGLSADEPLAFAGKYLRDTSDALSLAAEKCLDDVVAAADLCASSLGSGGKLLICGNGGSAADAQHLATEFVSTLTLDNRRPSIPALALTTDSSVLTAVANDFGFSEVFSRQVESLGRAGDVLIAISTSGGSANVVRAAEQAHAQGLHVLALTGADGGKLGALADVAIRAPSSVTAHIQECHLAFEHLTAHLVEDRLHPRSS
jgi:D-sedoheptulose 7-phosphate isomerase